jgi:hypothetical protein
MATIKSGATADQLTIDPDMKAARVTLYSPGAAGAAVHPTYSGAFITRVETVPSSTGGDSAYFTMRNTGSKQVFIRNINLICMFSGTGAINTRSLFKLERFTVATPSGGTVGVAVKRNTALAGSTSVGDIRYSNAAITTTGVTFEGGFHIFGTVNAPTGAATAVPAYPPRVALDFSTGGEEGRFALAVGEGLALRSYGTIVAGVAVYGSISWDER